jgi:hypothetical protein
MFSAVVLPDGPRARYRGIDESIMQSDEQEAG